jgi:hypothetical protein
MTRQEADFVIYEGEKYELLGDSSRQLPMVKQYGMQPQSWSTANWKGYVAEYVIVDQKLLLTSLMINDAANYYPEIGGIQPVIKGHYGAPVYEPLSELMSIKGAITIGRGEPENWHSFDIRSVHDYVIALKITLIDGFVQSIEDISEPGAAIRVKLQQIIKEREAYLEFPASKHPSLSEEWDKLFDESWALRYSTVENED